MKKPSHYRQNKRPRRLRQNDAVRTIVRENRLSTHDLILPLIVKDGESLKEPIQALPDIYRHSPDKIVEQAKLADELGIPMIMLFPFTDPRLKCETGKEALNPDSLIPRTIKAVKDAGVKAIIATDIALDPYTTHGHDGVLTADYADIDNDKTIDILVKQALLYADVGCDVLAPSDMMDGRINAIRNVLEEEGHINKMILSYTAKYASVFYGPYRDAVGSLKSLETRDQLQAPRDKKTYQMDPANSDEALLEAQLDIEEGADMLMVKPGMPYLDIIHRLKETFAKPTFAYQVSGEFAMLKHAANMGTFDFNTALLEALMCFKRSGCDGIVCYDAINVAKTLNS